MFTKIRKFLGAHGWVVPVVIGLVLRLINITRSSIWHDEGYTMWLLRYDFMDILARTARDVHPPGYYIIAKPWVMIFGDSVFSIRFFSLIFSVGIIYLAYRIIEMLVGKRAAYWTALFLAFSPFLIRFGQEARMYGVVAFFTTLATYFFVRYVKEKKGLYLLGYTAAMIVAMYTQYYSFFVIISLWLIYAVYTPDFWKFHWIRAIKNRSGVLDWKWWTANIALLALYAPWFPVAYKQVTRVGGSYWIKPEWITIRTIPGNVSQFLTYGHLDFLYSWQGALGMAAYWLIILALIGSGLLLFVDKRRWKVWLSLYIFGYLPMILVFVVSKLRTPIYQDRYFPFSAIAIFAIWGCLVAMVESKKVRIAAGSAMVTIMLSGMVIMSVEVNHQMKQMISEVRNNQGSGEVLVSGSLYTFLDGSYYMDYRDILFLSDSVNGYGETSLFYDQSDKYMISPDRLPSLGNRIWIIGRSGEDYISKSPLKTWSQTRVIEKGNIRAVLYTR